MSDKRLGLYVVKSFTCNSFLSSAAKNRKNTDIQKTVEIKNHAHTQTEKTAKHVKPMITVAYCYIYQSCVHLCTLFTNITRNFAYYKNYFTVKLVDRQQVLQ